jgi:DNA-binding MarR family transcriptional regulator
MLPTMGQEDAVDRMASQWIRERPDVDISPMEVVGRVSRLSRLVDREVGENFARHGIDSWMYDVLATLRRSGEPYELATGDLVRQTMVTTGAMTNRIDRLEQRGLVERVAATDRRKVIVRLSAAGRRLVDEVIHSHMETEERILSTLSDRQRRDLARQLRAILLHLGDGAPDQSGTT